MTAYEIVVFQNHDIYTITNASEGTVVKTYLEYCRDYVSPEYIEEKETSLYNTKMLISYVDNSGGDKPCNVLLIGRITSELLEEIRKGVADFYQKPKVTPHFMGN